MLRKRFKQQKMASDLPFSLEMSGVWGYRGIASRKKFWLIRVLEFTYLATLIAENITQTRSTNELHTVQLIGFEIHCLCVTIQNTRAAKYYNDPKRCFHFQGNIAHTIAQ